MLKDGPVIHPCERFYEILLSEITNANLWLENGEYEDLLDFYDP